MSAPPAPVRARDAALAAGTMTGILLALTGTPWRELAAATLVAVLVAALVAYALARLLAVWRS